MIWKPFDFNYIVNAKWALLPCIVLNRILRNKAGHMNDLKAFWLNYIVVLSHICIVKLYTLHCVYMYMYGQSGM